MTTHKLKAQALLNDACATIGDGQNSLLTALVKAYKNNEVSEEKAAECFLAIKKCADDALSNYHVAIKLPEAKASLKPRVTL